MQLGIFGDAPDDETPLARSFDAQTVAAAIACVEARRVAIVSDERRDDRRRVEARVRGGREPIVAVAEEGSDGRIGGTCTCAAAPNCAHVAAAWLAATAPPAAPLTTAFPAVANDVADWLRRVERSDAPRLAMRDAVGYFFEGPPLPSGYPALTVARLRRSGEDEFRRGTRLSLADIGTSPTLDVEPIDRIIVATLQLAATRAQAPPDDLRVIVAALMEQVLATGRCFAGRRMDVLSRGEPLRAEAPQDETEDGAWRYALVADANVDVVACMAPHYLDSARGVAGVLDVQLDAKSLFAVVTSPEMLEEEAVLAQAYLRDALGVSLEPGGERPDEAPLDASPPWEMRFDSVTGGWFDASLAVEIEGETIALLPILSQLIADIGDADPAARLRALARDERIVMRLGDGRRIALPVHRAERFAAILFELRTGGGEHERLSREQATSLAQAVAAEPSRDVFLDPTAPLLASLDELEARSAPADLDAQLRPYQAQGFAWLVSRVEAGFGALLADDMGLGKTVQTIALILARKASGALEGGALVVAPTTLLANWRDECARFAPGLRVAVAHGASRPRSVGDDVDVVVTSYALLARDAHLAERRWSLAVFDEAQALKNARSRVWEAARTIEAGARICISGTPVENHLGELWAILSCAVPGVLGDADTFTKRFRTPIEKHGDIGRLDALRRRIAPFFLRRTKESVLADLPPKTEILRSIELGEAQRDVYETVRVAMLARLTEAKSAGNRIVVLDALLKLRQVCCDPALLDLETAAAPSAKLEALIDMLEELQAQGRRVLVFSQFTSMLAIIADRLREAGIAYVELTGETKDRETPVARFSRGEAPVFLLSLKAGGTGLNLTAADTVIHYDPWWNPAAERQAEDRAHRIGQDRPVFVYRLVAAGSVEERVIALQRRKADLAESLMSDAVPFESADDDLKVLFAPLSE